MVLISFVNNETMQLAVLMTEKSNHRSHNWGTSLANISTIKEGTETRFCEEEEHGLRFNDI